MGAYDQYRASAGMGAMLSGANQGPGGDHPGPGLRGFRLGQGPMKLGESGPLSGQKMEDLSDRDLWTYSQAMNPNNPGREQIMNMPQLQAQKQKDKAWEKLSGMLLRRKRKAWEDQWRERYNYPQEPGLGQMHPAKPPLIHSIDSHILDRPEGATAYYVPKSDFHAWEKLAEEKKKAVTHNEEYIELADKVLNYGYGAGPGTSLTAEEKARYDKFVQLDDDYNKEMASYHEYIYSDNPWGYD